MNFTEAQLLQLKEKGISRSTVEKQLQRFETGFPVVKLKKAALVNHGIVRIEDDRKEELVKLYEDKKTELDILKFVPASGAATRMFKFLHEFLQEFDPVVDSINSFVNKRKARDLFTFFVGIEKFPFYEEVMAALKQENANWASLPDRDKKVLFVKKMLFKDGFNYTSMPKGLVPFHKYSNHIATAFEEHLHEASSYAASQNNARLHFTIAPAFRDDFKQEFQRIQYKVERKTGIKFKISFSHQQPKTDTIAVDLDDQPILNDDGLFFFRPAGHGALLENLNDQEADLIFIKNIDNVTVTTFEEEVGTYKKMLAGLLLEIQQKCFDYLKSLETQDPSKELLQEVEGFIKYQLHATLPLDYHKYTTKYQLEAIWNRLNRPLRICGMVKNEGEPGGGPFWVFNEVGQASLQIVESAQVDQDNHKQSKIASNCTHFNPVDLVCGVRDYQGNKFDLTGFRDLETGFITHKSRMGKELKAQELPGLWNGAMAHWNTIFVEVPLITFNPVKTVNDLLKPAHQG
ncbi:DUF4301 family protein [Nonlabens marinus]|uniref:Ribosylnicotinamide kinase n=1 Tax=Nonlabens marinus S1-08 TaxID=1454201 RepID=W8VNX3_9FLAO|nr:DUF4301 family protein [Nonlabens marinus]BAO54684.1 ribosylnicotinamide kinase [Nonlabens marinus S1-08]